MYSTRRKCVSRLGVGCCLASIPKQVSQSVTRVTLLLRNNSRSICVANRRSNDARGTPKFVPNLSRRDLGSLFFMRTPFAKLSVLVVADLLVTVRDWIWNATFTACSSESEISLLPVLWLFAHICHIYFWIIMPCFTKTCIMKFSSYKLLSRTLPPFRSSSENKLTPLKSHNKIYDLKHFNPRKNKGKKNGGFTIFYRKISVSIIISVAHIV
jgi:hypothetical protein